MTISGNDLAYNIIEHAAGGRLHNNCLFLFCFKYQTLLTEKLPYYQQSDRKISGTVLEHAKRKTWDFLICVKSYIWITSVESACIK